MKITIACTPSEGAEAARILAALRSILPGVRVHKNNGKSPYMHIFLTTRKPANPHDSTENA